MSAIAALFRLDDRSVVPDATREDLRLTADARLDNRAELCALLEAPAHATDGDLILRAYLRWGETCVEHLLGDFAFVIWDASRQSVFCARDHMGVKPFYYHYRPGRLFACASAIKALLALGEVPRTLNETRVAEYLTPVLEDPAITFYDAIVRLPAAHRLVITRDRARLERYWRLDPERELRPASDAACADEFRAIFTAAVRDRLRSDKPVGALLSGGLDSSSIACVARDLLVADGRAPLQTFSAVFPTVPTMDERAFIETVVDSGGFDPSFVSADRLSPLTDIDAMLRAEDEPFYAPNLYMHWALYACGAAQGIGVMLDGFDGDTTVSHGLLRLTELTRAGHWRTAVREARSVAPGLGVTSWRLVRNYCARPLVPAPARSALRRLRDWIPGRPAPSRVQLVAPALAERVRLPERLATLLAARTERLFTVRADQFRQLASGLLPFALAVAARAAASFGIEARFPFFDVRLVEFCLALPSDQKLRDGWTRTIERRAMEGILPPAVQWRRDKTNLFPHFIDALLRQERALLDRIVLGPSAELVRYVDLTALRSAYARYRARPMEDDALAVWRAVTLALWLEQQVSVPPSQETSIMSPDKSTPPVKQPKQPYVEPELTEHGTVEKITGNVGLKGSDGITGSTVG